MKNAQFCNAKRHGGWAEVPADRNRRRDTGGDASAFFGQAGEGIPELGIAKVIGVDPKTLRRHYRSELDLGHLKANSTEAQSLFRKATGEGPQSVTAGATP